MYKWTPYKRDTVFSFAGSLPTVSKQADRQTDKVNTAHTALIYNAVHGNNQLAL